MQAVFRSLISGALTGLSPSATGFSTQLGNSSRTYVKNFWEKGTAFPLPGTIGKKETHFTHNKRQTVNKIIFSWQLCIAKLQWFDYYLSCLISDTVGIWIVNTKHLNTRNIWILNFLKFRFQKVQYSNGRSMGYVLYTRPTIWIPDQYIKNKMASIFPVFKWLGCGIWKPYHTIWHLTSFQPFEYQTSLVFRSPL